MSMMDNPWKVETFKDFLYYCCPQCDTKTKEETELFQHAISNHELAKDTFGTNIIKKEALEVLEKPKASTEIVSPRKRESEEPGGVQQSKRLCNEILNVQSEVISGDISEDIKIEATDFSDDPLSIDDNSMDQDSYAEHSSSENTNEERVEETGKIARSTMKAKNRALRHFFDFMKNHGYENITPQSTIWSSTTELQELLIKYFQSFRVGNNEIPKRGSMECNRSHLKMSIKEYTQSHIDICDRIRFPKFTGFWITYCKALGKTDHRPPIQKDHLKKLYELLSILQNLMELNENDEMFEATLMKLPIEWQTKYHYLVMYGAIMILVFQFTRRGEEGLENLTKHQVLRLIDNESGVEYFGKRDRKFQCEDNDQDGGGFILFEDNVYNFNPGKYFALFLEKLHAEAPYVFSRPIRPRKDFILHSNPQTWYETNKIGVNEVSKALPVLCSVLEIPHLTNGQLRPTAIQLMHDADYEDQDSGKKGSDNVAVHKIPQSKQLDKIGQRSAEQSIISNSGIKVEPIVPFPFDGNLKNYEFQVKGNAANTLNAKKRAQQHFFQFMKSQGYESTTPDSEIWTSVTALQELLISYFQSYRVGNDELPKRGTVEVTRSHLKMTIKEYTDGQIDISDRLKFPKLGHFMSNLCKALGKTEHRLPIEKDHIKKLYELLSLLQKLMELNENDELFEATLMELPQEWHEKYHYLVMYGAIMILVVQFTRRGEEGLENLTRGQVERFIDRDSGIEYFGKVGRNYQNEQDVQDGGGFILFEENVYNFNPGKYFAMFLEKLHMDAEYIFSRPIRPRKDFILQSNPQTWYETNKIGNKEVAKALPVLCSVLGIPHLTNCQLRPTAIQLMHDAGYKDQDIMFITGHKRPDNVKKCLTQSYQKSNSRIAISRIMSNTEDSILS